MNRIIFLCLFGPFSQMYSQSIYRETLVVNFDKDKDFLTSEAITSFTNRLLKYKNYFIDSIVISAHTDGDGANQYNIDLSRRRANTIKNIVDNSNLNSEIYIASYFGENKLLERENTEHDKAINRRVEVFIKYLEAKNIEELTQTVQNNDVQIFSFDPKILQMRVIAKKGTEININRNTLEYEDGTSLDSLSNVEIKVKEIQTFLDQIQENISTESDEGILESGGMVKIDVNADGKKLKVKPGNTYTLTLPDRVGKNGMSVYKGIKSENGNITWQQTEANFQAIKKMNTKRPSVCIDDSILTLWNIRPKLSSFLAVKEFNIQIPYYPSEPIKPKKPRMISSQNKLFQPNLFQRIFCNATRKEQIVAKKYAPHLAKYNKKLAKYEGKLWAYNENVKNYPAKCITYSQNVVKFQSEVDSAILRIKYYKLAKREQQYLRNMKNKLQKMIALSKKDSLFVYNPKQFLLDNTANFRPDANFKSMIAELKETIKMFKEANRHLPLYKNIVLDKIILNDHDLYAKAIRQFKTDSNNLVLEYLAARENELKVKEQRVNYKANTTSVFQAELNDFQWINCDRFRQVSPNLMANYSIINELEQDIKERKTFLIIPAMNSCISISEEFQVPNYTKGKIISYYINSENKIKIATSELVPNGDKLIKLEYEESTLKTFSNLLSSL